MSIWRPVPGWVGLYEVSDAGEVRSLPRHGCKGRMLRFGRSHNGYPTVTFSADGRRHTRTLHRVVAEVFLGPLPRGMQTLHIDGDKNNNAVANLRYGTQSENERDKVRHGTQYNAIKTHCPRDHEYTPENTRIDKKGSRSCKTCHRERNQRARLAARQAAAQPERLAA
jgi:hypothetical protein